MFVEVSGLPQWRTVSGSYFRDDNFYQESIIGMRKDIENDKENTRLNYKDFPNQWLARSWGEYIVFGHPGEKVRVCKDYAGSLYIEAKEERVFAPNIGRLQREVLFINDKRQWHKRIGQTYALFCKIRAKFLESLLKEKPTSHQVLENFYDEYAKKTRRIHFLVGMILRKGKGKEEFDSLLNWFSSEETQKKLKEIQSYHLIGYVALAYSGHHRGIKLNTSMELLPNYVKKIYYSCQIQYKGFPDLPDLIRETKNF